MRRTICLAVAALACAASMAWSQEAGQRRGRGGRMGPADVEQAVVLTAEQKEKVQALLEKTRQEMRDRMGQGDRSAFQAMRETRQQMLEAAEAGDDKKVESLQKELNGSEAVAQRRKMTSEYYDEVEKLLTPEQKKPFQAWRKLVEADVPPAVIGDPEALKEALKKVNLSEAQQKKVDAAFNRAEAKEGDVAQAKARNVDLAAAVVETLKPSQKVLLVSAVSGRGGAGRARGDGAASAPAR